MGAVSSGFVLFRRDRGDIGERNQMYAREDLHHLLDFAAKIRLLLIQSTRAIRTSVTPIAIRELLVESVHAGFALEQ